MLQMLLLGILLASWPLHPVHCIFTDFPTTYIIIPNASDTHMDSTSITLGSKVIKLLSLFFILPHLLTSLLLP